MTDHARLLALVLAEAEGRRRDPSPDEAPTWCLLADLTEDGCPPDPDDPMREAAFWELVAWTARRMTPEADAFAAVCLALADECMAGVAL